MDRKNADRALQALDGVLQGDPRPMSILSSIDHEGLRTAVAARGQPTLVTRPAVVRLLQGLLEDAWSPWQAQAWASFVRRGYVAGGGKHPIRAINIKYEDACEEAIAAAVYRLDEIGDVVDGDVSTGEILDLLQLLGEP